jgi:hypothetical protein
MLLCLLLAAAPAAKAWPPPLLSQTGLFTGSPAAIEKENRPFAPQYPLWSDGAQKRRWIRLPRGTTIDAKDPESWVFPVGTRFWKEFSFNGKRGETRFIEKTARGAWRFATYAWNEAETDAALVPEQGQRNAVEIEPDTRHDLPSVADCKACHEGAGREAILGFNALQLSPDRDPNAPHREDVPEGAFDDASLVKEKRLVHAPAKWAEHPPAIAAKTPTERAALGYLHGNCWGCHNEKDPVASVGMSLRASILVKDPAEQPTIRTALDVFSRFQTPGVEAHECKRILPGDAEKSSVLFRMRSRHPARQMPPIGTKIIDGEALALLSRWVTETTRPGRSP